MVALRLHRLCDANERAHDIWRDMLISDSCFNFLSAQACVSSSPRRSLCHIPTSVPRGTSLPSKSNVQRRPLRIFFCSHSLLFPAMKKNTLKVLVLYMNGRNFALAVEVCVKAWEAVTDTAVLESWQTCVEPRTFCNRHCATYKVSKSRVERFLPTEPVG